MGVTGVWIVMGMLVVLIAFGMPIGFALMISATIAMGVSGVDLIMAPIQLFSGTNKVVLLAIPLFILMGELMGATSISDRIIGLARALVGWMRGGLAHVNVVTSMFMAEMSGSAVADAAVMSKIFVPSMEKQGYPKRFAAAVTATSATLRIIIPPSIPMVLYRGDDKHLYQGSVSCWHCSGPAPRRGLYHHKLHFRISRRPSG